MGELFYIFCPKIHNLYFTYYNKYVKIKCNNTLRRWFCEKEIICQNNIARNGILFCFFNNAI